LYTARQPFDPARLEIRTPRLDRLDGEARVLDPPQDPFPLRFDTGRILFYEMKLRARRECFGEAHSWAHSRPLGCARARTYERPLPRCRCKRNRFPAQLRLIP
jgi:hypothetical protein